MDNKGLKIGVGVAAAVAVTSAGVYAAKTVAERQKSAKLAEARQKWESVGENVVVLHHFRRPSSAPSFSPFNIKLETYLRMAGMTTDIIYIYVSHAFVYIISRCRSQVRL